MTTLYSGTKINEIAHQIEDWLTSEIIQGNNPPIGLCFRNRVLCNWSGIENIDA
jgi:hypothetical protein